MSCIIASKNERNVGVWLLLSVFFGFLATIVVLAIGPANPAPVAVAAPFQHWEPTPERVPCVRCGESIAAAAQVCRFCGVEVAGEAVRLAGSDLH